MEQRNRIQELLTSYIDNSIDKASFEELMVLLNDLNEADFKKLVDSRLREIEQKEINPLIQAHLKKTQTALNDSIRKDTRIININWKIVWIPIAAAIALFIIIRFPNKLKEPESEDQKVIASIVDISPAQNKATIVVDNQVIELNNNKLGIDFHKDSISMANGDKLSLKNQEFRQISIKTPRGGQYQIVLIDGTKVWLNAASEISYNGDFGINHRDLQVKGEVYFEVAKNQKLPFTVSYHDQKLIVLGTTFNINAYDDEDKIKTTLIEGAMKVLTANHASHLLKPDQQLEYNTNTNGLKLKQVDPSAEISWKNGIFDFHNLSLAQAMRTVSRWYNIDIHYTEDIPNLTLGGKMSRGVKLTTFLQFLEENFGIHTTLSKDRILTISTRKP